MRGEAIMRSHATSHNTLSNTLIFPIASFFQYQYNAGQLSYYSVKQNKII